jgi:hypothetical protein
MIRNRRSRYRERLSVIWLSTLLLSSVILLVTDRADLVTLTGVWILGSLVSSSFAIARYNLRPSFRDIKLYIYRHVTLIRSLVPEGLFYAAATQASPFIIAATLSISALGQVRGAQTVMGLASMLYMGLAPTLTVEARKRASNRTSLWRLITIATLAICTFVLCYGLLATMIPSRFLRSVFGDSISASTDLILPATLSLAGLGLFGSFLIGLRFLCQPRTAATLRIAATTADLLGASLGALTAGAAGAMYGSAIASLILGSIAAALVYRLTRAADASPIKGTGVKPNRAVDPKPGSVGASRE